LNSCDKGIVLGAEYHQRPAEWGGWRQFCVVDCALASFDPIATHLHRVVSNTVQLPSQRPNQKADVQTVPPHLEVR
jgi:hypothetical protein